MPVSRVDHAAAARPAARSCPSCTSSAGTAGRRTGPGWRRRRPPNRSRRPRRRPIRWLCSAPRRKRTTAEHRGGRRHQNRNAQARHFFSNLVTDSARRARSAGQQNDRRPRNRDAMQSARRTHRRTGSRWPSSERARLSADEDLIERHDHRRDEEAGEHHREAFTKQAALRHHESEGVYRLIRVVLAAQPNEVGRSAANLESHAARVKVVTVGALVVRLHRMHPHAAPARRAHRASTSGSTAHAGGAARGASAPPSARRAPRLRSSSMRVHA